MRRSVLSAALLIFALAVPVVAAEWVATTNAGLNDPVEQQSPDWNYASNAYNLWRCTHAEDGTPHPDNCVHNPTPCTWDTDDYLLRSATGDIASGQTVTVSACFIADGHPDNISAGVLGKAGLSVSVNGTPVASAPDGRLRRWQYCAVDQSPGPYPSIEGSNGGVGLVVPVALSITNTTTKAIRDVGAGVHLWEVTPGPYATRC